MDNKPNTNNLARYAGLSTQWGVMLAVAAYLGHKLDLWTAWKIPAFVILLPLFALMVSMWQLIKEVNKPKK